MSDQDASVFLRSPEITSDTPRVWEMVAGGGVGPDERAPGLTAKGIAATDTERPAAEPVDGAYSLAELLRQRFLAHDGAIVATTLLDCDEPTREGWIAVARLVAERTERIKATCDEAQARCREWEKLAQEWFAERDHHVSVRKELREERDEARGETRTLKDHLRQVATLALNGSGQ